MKNSRAQFFGFVEFKQMAVLSGENLGSDFGFKNEVNSGERFVR